MFFGINRKAIQTYSEWTHYNVLIYVGQVEINTEKLASIHIFIRCAYKNDISILISNVFKILVKLNKVEINAKKKQKSFEILVYI